MNAQVEAEMKSVNSRLSRIGDALMTTKDPGGVSIDVDGNLRATWRKFNGKTYFIVLNNSTQSVVAKMDVKGVSSSAKVDGENRSDQAKRRQHRPRRDRKWRGDLLASKFSARVAHHTLAYVGAARIIALVRSPATRL